MTVRTAASLTAFAAIVVLALGYIASLGIRLGPPSDRTTLTMSVLDTNGLVVGSNVLLRGVPIGQVTDLRASGDGAEVTFYYGGAHAIPVDTEFRVDNLSALGESYIGLLPRTASGPVLRDGQHLATEQITAPPSVAELSANVVHLLEQADPEQLARIIAEADAALPDGNAVLPNLARSSELLAAAIAGLPGKGSELLGNSQDLLRNAGFVGPAIAAAGPELAGISQPWQNLLDADFRMIRETNAPDSLTDFGAYLARIQGFLDASAPDLKILSKALLPGVQALTASAREIDTGQLLDSVLAAVPADGSITLHVRPGN